MVRVPAGYKLEAGEAERLLDAVDTGHTGRVAKGQFAASQIDWAALQADRAAWLARARSAFRALDADGDGVCGVDEIVACLARKLPLGEVRAAAARCREGFAVTHGFSTAEELSELCTISSGGVTAPIGLSCLFPSFLQAAAGEPLTLSGACVMS